jgi:predicted DNA-binding WGR domain protein
MTNEPGSTHLVRRDPSRNMAHFYILEVTPDLFGGAILIRNWGRQGHHGQELRKWFADLSQAEDERDTWRRRKLQRGYKAVQGQANLCVPQKDIV